MDPLLMEGSAPQTHSNSWFTAVLAEYSAVRAEIVQALQAQHAIVAYGVSAVAVLSAIAASLSGESERGSTLIGLVFSVINPLLLALIFVIWASEVLRMQRAGTYLFVLERSINKALSGPRALNWEHAVNPPPEGNPLVPIRRSTRRSFPHVDRLQRVAVPAVLLAMAVGSITAGVLMGQDGWLLVIGALEVGAVITVWLWLESERRLMRCQYADVCRLDGTDRPFTVELWLRTLQPWPTLADRVRFVRRGERWSSLRV